MLTDLNIYPTNNKTDHISEKISGFGSGSGSGSVISRNGSEDPDPYQNETDPQHCKLECHFTNLKCITTSFNLRFE